MNVDILREIPLANLVEKLRKIELKGNRKIHPYEDCQITLDEVDPDFLSPVSRYVTKPGLEVLKQLEHGFRMNAGPDYYTTMTNFEISKVDRGYIVNADGAEWMIIPPLIELSMYDGGAPLVMDGIHRAWLAREEGRRVKVLVMKGVIIPYYGLPLPNRWNDVHVVDEVPEHAEKRIWRIPDPKMYYELYRDLEPLGIGKPRTPTKAVQTA